MPIIRDGKKIYLRGPQLSCLQLDLAASKVKKNAFKLALFSKSIPAIFEGEDVCAKCTYHAAKRVVNLGETLPKKVVNVPHKDEKQFQYLTMEVLCLFWAQVLLDTVYDHVKEVDKVSK